MVNRLLHLRASSKNEKLSLTLRLLYVSDNGLISSSKDQRWIIVRLIDLLSAFVDSNKRSFMCDDEIKATRENNNGTKRQKKAGNNVNVPRAQ